MDFLVIGTSTRCQFLVNSRWCSFCYILLFTRHISFAAQKKGYTSLLLEIIAAVMPLIGFKCWFGKWSRFASCGVYGSNRMGDFSRIPKEVGRIFYISFLLLSSLGRQLGLPLLWLFILIFFSSSLVSLRRFLVYFMCIRVAPSARFLYNITYSKNKVLVLMCLKNYKIIHCPCIGL